MCGIFCLIENKPKNINCGEEGVKEVFESYKEIISNAHNKLIHRGPDSQGNNLLIDPEFNKSIVMVHNRLKINGDNTKQPLINNDNTLFLVMNGEVFNYKELENELDYKCVKSDCEIIFPLYLQYKNDIPEMLNKLNGQFSFVLYDVTTKHVLVARDHIGITPMYIGYKKNDSGNCVDRMIISSELKALTDDNLVDNIKVFHPRTYLHHDLNDSLENYHVNIYTYKNYYNIKNIEEPQEGKKTTQRSRILENIKNKLEKSVKLRVKDLEVEYGVLLSGGLDSSLIASLVVNNSNKKVKTFSIGINENSPDIIAARVVAEFLGTEHKEYYFTIEEGLQNIQNVIYAVESYDCTTIRASTPMYLLVKKIKEDYPELKVLFSGELSDELLCYLYGANAPSEIDFHNETVKLVSNVHLFDCLRANKSCMAHSVEVRVPFTDKDFVEYVLSVHPYWKMFNKTSNNKIEKKILRDAFDGYLPNKILYRKKEQFSDGISGFNEKSKDNWIDAVKEYTNKLYSDVDFNSFCQKYNYNKPSTKEHLYYREIFCKLFNKSSYINTSELTVKMWQPNWCDNKDPSGRVQNFWHKN